MHITSVQTESFDARRPLVFRRSFAHLDGSSEGIPGVAAPLLFHGTPGRESRRFYPGLPKFPQKSLLDCSTGRSEEHTSELQSHLNLVCRLLLEKKKKKELSNKTEILIINDTNRV